MKSHSIIAALMGTALGATLLFFIPDRTAAQAGGCVNVAGVWEIKSEIDPGTCEEKIDPVEVEGTFKQDGCDVTLDIGVTLKGNVTGNRVKLKGEYWWMGTTTKDIDMVIRGNTLTGKGKWTYSALGYKCAGTEDFQGQRKQ
jgi:hypothetical protein